MRIESLYHRRDGSISPPCNANGVVDMTCHMHRPRMYAMHAMFNAVPSSPDRVLSDTSEHYFIYRIMPQPTVVQAFSLPGPHPDRFARLFQLHPRLDQPVLLIARRFQTSAYCVWSLCRVRNSSSLPWKISLHYPSFTFAFFLL
jgi:hypothetical protein